MRIRFLEANNFRRFKDVEISFGEKNAFFGPNASGKTSILEAIYMLCWGKSFRTLRDSETIRWGENSGYIRGEFEGEDFLNIRVSLLPSSKRIQINGKNATRMSLIGKIPVFFLSPEELSMLDGPPKMRRDFLNKVLSQLDKDYLSNYRLYLKLLREKNAALSKGGRAIRVVEIINERLLKVSLYIWESRRKLLSYLSDDEMKIVYKPSGMRIEIALDSVKKALHGLVDKEIKRGYALFGPHLDDFDVLREGGFSYRRFASRGERKWVIWRIFSKIIGLFEKRERLPIFLVDEILSELDGVKANAVMEEMSAIRAQVFFTTLNKEHVRGDFRAFEVKDGEIRGYNR
ncbi:MAG: DNA replication and repair protein RecF [bacterium 42_11]|nr:MAG: DNA replication and repair protein RecF [bacterium 42_11]